MYEDRVSVYHGIEYFQAFCKRIVDKDYDVYVSNDLRSFIADESKNHHCYHKRDYWIYSSSDITPEVLRKISCMLYDKGVQERLDDLENDIKEAIEYGRED